MATVQEFIKVHTVLQKVAKNHQRWNMAKHFAHVKLQVSKDGIIKLILPQSRNLTSLAIDIRRLLKKNNVPISSRFDFPSHAHITLGTVPKNQVKHFKQKLDRCKRAQQIALSSLMKTHYFPINQFMLLKSNRPAPKRKYARLSSYTL